VGINVILDNHVEAENENEPNPKDLYPSMAMKREKLRSESDTP
jgi:hypothetical protein